MVVTSKYGLFFERVRLEGRCLPGTPEPRPASVVKQAGHEK